MPPFRKRNVLEMAEDRESLRTRDTNYRSEPLGHAFRSAKRAKVPLTDRIKLTDAFTRASDTGDKGGGHGEEDTGTPKPTIRRKEARPCRSKKSGKGNDRIR